RLGRGKFVAFLKDGLGGDWDKAVKAHYGFPNVEELEKEWLTALRLQPAPAAPTDNRPIRTTGSAPLTALAGLTNGRVTVRWPQLSFVPRTTEKPGGGKITSYELHHAENRSIYYAA